MFSMTLIFKVCLSLFDELISSLVYLVMNRDTQELPAIIVDLERSNNTLRGYQCVAPFVYSSFK